MSQVRAVQLLTSIVEIQLGVQNKVAPEWRESEIRPDISAKVEIAEAIMNVGRTDISDWWKKTPFLKGQYMLELVDTLVFSILATAKDSGSDLRVISDMVAGYHLYIDGMAGEELYSVQDPNDKVRHLDELLSGTVYGFDEDHYSRLFNIMCQEAGGIEGLYKWYTAKSVLNHFRKDNGYKDGTYIKLWDGTNEDNFFLEGILEDIVGEWDRETLEATIYDKLAQMYKVQTGKDAAKVS